MTGIGIAIVVLPYPYVAYGTLIASLFCAAVLSRFGPQNSRSFWRWFSCSGWLTILLSVPLVGRFETSRWCPMLMQWIQDNNLAVSNWTQEQYIILGISVLTLTVSIMGGVLIPLLIHSYRSRHLSDEVS